MTGSARRWKHAPLFDGVWRDMGGRRLGRATRYELREAYRVWFKHRDVRNRARVG